MKKGIFFLLMFLAFPIMGFAKDYEVQKHIIDSEIEIGGALKIQELIIVNGTTDSISRTVNKNSFGDKSWDGKTEVDFEGNEFYNGYGISNVKVLAYKYDGKFDINNLTDGNDKFFDIFDMKKPSDKTYTYEEHEDGTASIKMFYPVNNETVAFYLTYTITNVIVKHNDVKELNYTFKNINYDCKDNLFRLITPYPIEKDDQVNYHVWVHGNQTGVFNEMINEKEQKLGLYGTFTEMGETNFRMVFPQKYVGIDLYLNSSNIDALDKIIEVENGRSDKTNLSNNLKNILSYIVIGITALYVVASFIFIKLSDLKIFILFLVLGVVISIINFLFFGFKYWYLFFAVLIPIICNLVNKFIIKKA